MKRRRMKRDFWKFVCKYIYDKRKGAAVFALFCLIFTAVFLLYGLPLGAVVYPALLCGMAGLILLAADGRRAWLRFGSLQDILQEMDTEERELPMAEDMVEESYRQIVIMLRKKRRQMENDMNARYTDRIDYYTLWAHQIKTPITSLKLILQNEDTGRSRQMLSELFSIEQYVEMVLCYLRLDSDSTDYVLKEYSLDEILRPAVKKFAGQFIGKKLSLNYEPVKTQVLTDAKWLSFVAEQVISNAVKYTKKGGITIYMEEQETLCISDTGIGIAPEDLPRIFEKGYTGCNGHGEPRSSGIGLYLCRRICSNLGHTIAAESRIGQGTLIRIGLKRRKLEAE